MFSVLLSAPVLLLQDTWHLSKETVADLKEVFMLFDKDEDGVLSFPELEVVMKNLGQRPSGQASLWLNLPSPPLPFHL